MLTNSTLCQWDFKFFPILCHDKTILLYERVSHFFRFIARLVIANAASYLFYKICYNNKAEEVISPEEAISPDVTVLTHPSLEQQPRLPTKNYLTKSTAIINDWIYKSKCVEFHTVIPDYPTVLDQKKFSRLVMIELLVSFQKSRLQRLIRQTLLKPDISAIRRINAVSTLFLLVLGIEFTKPNVKKLSAGILSTSNEYASKQFFKWMAPFDVTERKLMLKLGFDEGKYKLPVNTPDPIIALENFIKRDKFMTRPDRPDISKKSKRVLKRFRYMTPENFAAKITEIKNGIYDTKIESQRLSAELHDKNKELVKNRNHRFLPVDETIDVLKRIMIARKKNQELLVRAEKIKSRKKDRELYNAIFEANSNAIDVYGTPIDQLVMRIAEARIEYEEMLHSVFDFRKKLDKYEEKYADWILEKIACRFPVNEWTDK
ncbi:hypothetical protein HPULCUR_004256 [Helicostylum pulchrum]|uniref:Uncharacterized protein n=1 Tax=Helicostylum pulchrum TaxID=562976 RepID=A0ABP9XWU5_9FUNG